MRGLIEVLLLEMRSLVRSRALAILLGVSTVWMLAAPYVFRSDGTDAGARELCVRYSMGAVAALLAVVLTIVAAGSLAGERTAKRLQLTVVRPVNAFAVVLGKALALVLAGALVLGVAAAIELVRQDPSRSCWSVRRPILPSPAEEAAAMYDSYIADSDTPIEVKRAKKSTVLRLLTQRALDHYQTVDTNATVVWRFAMPTDDSPLALRLRFTNMFDMRDEVRGALRAAGRFAAVSNITQAVITVPLDRCESPNASALVAPDELRFTNLGSRSVMLRPRKDVELLVRADSFAANLLRAYLQLVAILAVLVAFGVFLGAALSRPVAVFVAVVTIALSEMSPSVVSQYPDELETDRRDAIGLVLARSAATATHPIGALDPLSDLAADNRVETAETLRVWLVNVVSLPLVLMALSAFLIRRKAE